jgi:sugar/nucleoside kinase (ribokinase family)
MAELAIEYAKSRGWNVITAREPTYDCAPYTWPRSWSNTHYRAPSSHDARLTTDELAEADAALRIVLGLR